MDKELLIKKWLEGTLTPKEETAFKKLDDYASYERISDHARHFAPPSFDENQNWEAIQEQKTKTIALKKFNWSRVAAIAVVLIIGSYFTFFFSQDTTIKTGIAQQQSVTLPDASIVVLNASSILTYNEDNWNKERRVTLEGEAFFKVAKGQTFTVQSKQGTVEVLGTQFNVKDRSEEYKVETFEGLVAVTTPKETFKLPAGNGFQIIGNMQRELQPKPDGVPSWTQAESTFISTPVNLVIRELEIQYNITITSPDIDSNTLFTGSFTHKNIDQALKSITVPLQLSYTINNNQVTLHNL